MDSEENVHVPVGFVRILKKLKEANSENEKILALIDGLIWYEQDNYETQKSHTGLVSQGEIFEHKIAVLEGMKKGFSPEKSVPKIPETKITISQDDSKLTEEEVLEYFSKIKSGEYTRMKNTEKG